jgi:integrase/recombinase XerD
MLRLYLTALYEYSYNSGMSKPIQGLVLYKRHTPRCEDAMPPIPADRRKFWMECECPIWIYGRDPKGNVVERQTTGARSIKDAEAIRDSYVSHVSGDEIHGPSISECVGRFVASRADDIEEKTQKHYLHYLTGLQTFCAKRGIYFMHQLNADVLETFKSEGLAQLKSSTRGNAFAMVRCFLKAAYRRDWTTEPLAEKVPAAPLIQEQKEPYTNEEVDAILGAASTYHGGGVRFRSRPETFRLLLELMLETGMRVGDAIQYDPAGVFKGEAMWIYQFFPQKTRRTAKPKIVEAYLPDRLKRAIDRCDWVSKARPFNDGKMQKDVGRLGTEAYERMHAIGAECGVSDCRPHRLRDTFAVRKLLCGMSLDDVSHLLGHSSVKVTETYYARWVKGRKVRLERLVAQSLVDASGDTGRD